MREVAVAPSSRHSRRPVAAPTRGSPNGATSRARAPGAKRVSASVRTTTSAWAASNRACCVGVCPARGRLSRRTRGSASAIASTTASVPSVEPSLPTITSRIGLAGPSWASASAIRSATCAASSWTAMATVIVAGCRFREEADRPQARRQGDHRRIPEVHPQECGERDHGSNGKQQHDARSVPAQAPSCGRDGVVA